MQQQRNRLSAVPVMSSLAAAVVAALYPGAPAVAQDNSAALDEIIVTATKRAVSVQNIPASVQAITQESLAKMGAKDMEDYSRFLPSVTVVTYGGNPGANGSANAVVFRGARTGGDGFISQSTSSVYLDEISITSSGNQPAIRMADIERVEALAGPQGTVFGSDAQAGTLRIITNKPKMNVFETIADGELRTGKDSDASYRGSLTFNIPLVEDTLAMRVVGFHDHDGGFIDNVLGHTPDTSALFGAGHYPTGFGTLDNSAAVEENWNDADISGGRVHLLWNMNDDWSATATALAQRTDAGAGNDYDPFVGDLKTVRFNKDYRKDDFQMYSLVLNGDLSFGQLVGAVNYFERDIKYRLDLTAYAHYWAANYCHDSSYTAADKPFYWTNPDTGNVVLYPVYCQGPTLDGDFFSTKYWVEKQDKFSTEIRLSGQGDTIDYLVGAYYEDSNAAYKTPFAAPTTGGDGSTSIYQDSVSLQYWEMYFSNLYGTPTTYPEATSHWFGAASVSGEQTAVFGQVTWHINEDWDLTLGGRYFRRTNGNRRWVDHPGDMGLNGEPDIGDPLTRAFRLANGGTPPLNSATEKKFIPLTSLSYNLSDNKMVYGLYTIGARPGGVNETRGQPFFPSAFAPDEMVNYEVGYRSMFGGGRGRLNATYYYMKWDDYQLSVVDPSRQPCPTPGDSIAGVCGQPFQNIIANAGQAHITGVNVELDYAVNDRWVIGANGVYQTAQTDTTKDLDGDGQNDLVGGLDLPLTPNFKGSAWVDYTQPGQWFGGGTEAFGRVQMSYSGDSVNKLDPVGETDPNPQFTNPSYMIVDMRVGVRGEDWEVSVFLNNITDKRAIYTIGTGMTEWGASSVADGRPHVQRNFTNRPREFGIHFTKRWGG